MSTVRTVSQGLNLVLPMESPARLANLMGLLGQEETRQKIRSALRGLHYVHFARFLPLFEVSTLLVITEFDGRPPELADTEALRAYAMDFAAVLSDEFTLILSHTRNKPRLPVRDFPEDFWRYVQAHHDARFQPFSAYDDKTVIDIVGQPLSPRMPPGLPPQALGVDAADVQGNILRGYRAAVAEHLALAVVDDPRAARALLGKLAQAGPTELHISTGAAWQRPEPDHCLTVGLTHEGLARLGVAPEVLAHFPRAFREGAARRARDNWDIDDAGPEHWRIGGTGGPEAHLLFSLMAKDEKVLARRLASLLAACETAGLRVVGRQATTMLGRPGRIHFGYQDGLSQPRIPVGTPTTPTAEDGQPWAPPGDFLLGHTNNTGGDYLGDLPAKLGRNGTYAAFRLIRQDTAAFEKKVAEVAKSNPPLTFDQVAAKLMGRALDGRPLQLPAPGAQAGDNRFDYGDPQAGALGVAPDPHGAVCPFGAHVRRANPRSGLVMGRPFAHRVIRRGLPYVSRWMPEENTPYPESGLAGLFICGDLEEQFEFVQRHYINGDLATGTARHLHDPIAGRHRAGEARFVFSPGPGLPDVTIDNLPQWTTTVGSLYLFMPGLQALRLLAQGAWSAKRKPAVYPGRFDASRFNPHDPAFLADPYPFYAEFRRAAPVSWIAAHGCYWVFSHALVTQVCAPCDDPVFLKPGNQETRKGPPLDAERNLPDGLFFMNPPEHTRVRPLMDQALESAIGNARSLAAASTQAALDKAAAKGERALELISSLASVVPRQVFMQVMGWADDPLGIFRGWVRQVLDAHDHSADPATQVKGATSGMALRAYFQALGRGCPVAHGAGQTHGASAAGAACPAGGMYGSLQAQVAQGRLAPLALQESALHFALGGYLSTEFLITTGVLNLLRHPEQLQWLRANPNRMQQAVREMLRYDAPFQLADRIVARDTELGGVKLRKGDRLAVVYGSANHDETVFNDIHPDRFDIRKPSAHASRAYGFGHGIHYCIGARLAEMVAEETLATLLNRHPALRLGEFGPWRTDPYFRSVHRLLLLTQ